MAPCRMRCLVLCVKAAKRVFETAEKHDLYDMLADFCKKVSFSHGLQNLEISRPRDN